MVALSLLNPLLIGSSKDQRDQYIAKVQEHSDFWPLVATLEGLLVSDPENALNGDVYPELMSRLVAISVAALESFGTSDNPREYYAPHIEDADGAKIAFVNPTFLYYGASVQGTKHDLQLVYPEASLLSYQPGWPPVFQTQPKRTEYELGNGQFDIVMYRGMDFANMNADAWTNYDSPEGRASLANMAKGITLTIDLATGVVWTAPRGVDTQLRGFHQLPFVLGRAQIAQG
jgi:hypothetical protein